MPHPTLCRVITGIVQKCTFALYTTSLQYLQYFAETHHSITAHCISALYPPKPLTKPAAEFPKKIIHLKVWSTIHVLSFNPKFDLNPRLTHIPKQGIVCWEVSFRKRKSYLIFAVKQGYTHDLCFILLIYWPRKCFDRFDVVMKL